MISKPLVIIGGAVLAVMLCSCTGFRPKGDALVISVSDQRLVLMNKGVPVKSYSVSTSKFGLGSKSRSYKTPLGKMYVHQKIGDGARSGTVFKGRRPTGEVLRPNTPGRDPIVSRILWLEGRERSNRNTMERMIYIHGTPEERNIGRPVSYGCVRMKSRDVIDLYGKIAVGTKVYIKRSHLALAEIPRSDRGLMVAARGRGRTLAPGKRSGVVYAAAAPAPPQVMKPRPAVRPQVKKVFPTIKRVSPTKVSPAKGKPPRRRGAFTKVSAAISTLSSRAIARVTGDHDGTEVAYSGQ